MQTRIADWGVEFAFIRTQVGAEFGIADSLGDVPNPPCVFFGTYGYFDLAAVRCIERLSTPYLVLLDRRIAESAPFRFFADRDNHSKGRFEKDLASWHGAILVFAKIHASIGRRDRGQARWAAARLVRQSFQEAHVFFGLGYSELLLVAGGSNLATLLDAVTKLRELRDPQNTNLPLFSKTTTFPLVSCAQVHREGNYQLLTGEVDPVITASCEPTVEQHVAKAVDRQTQYVRNIYGKSDLLIGWKNPVPITELATFLTEFRRKWGTSGAVTKTSTYLESQVRVGENGPITALGSLPTSENALLPELMTEDEERSLFDKLRHVEPHALRAALSDLTLRLSSCLNDTQLTDHFRDMANIFAHLPSLLESLEQPTSKHEARFAAEAVADLARAAINQRYAGLELHPETLAHARAPLLCDIRSIVAAASCIPHFIFDNLWPNRRASETWAGFVLFGGANAPQYLHQQVLGLPPSSLFAPIEGWWKTTHEAAHGVFKTLQVYEKIPDRVIQYIEDSVQESGLDPYHLINELFANWFDWNSVFNRDMSYYLKTIWSSWVELPIVRKSKSQYLARSFAVFICPRLSELIPLFQKQWIDAGRPWLYARWEEFIEVLRSVSMTVRYLDDLKESEKQNALVLTCHCSQIMHFFENSFEHDCGVVALNERLNPPYLQLAEHIGLLKQGNVIMDSIPNPYRLHLELLKSLNDESPSLAVEIAYIFSLENSYLLARDSQIQR
jgi:hypothetical protein